MVMNQPTVSIGRLGTFYGQHALKRDRLASCRDSQLTRLEHEFVLLWPGAVHALGRDSQSPRSVTGGFPPSLGGAHGHVRLPLNS